MSRQAMAPTTGITAPTMRHAASRRPRHLAYTLNAVPTSARRIPGARFTIRTQCRTDPTKGLEIARGGNAPTYPATTNREPLRAKGGLKRAVAPIYLIQQPAPGPQGPHPGPKALPAGILV